MQILSVVAIIIAIGSMIFTAIQTRILTSQTRLLQATAELSYNLELIGRMNDIILEIASKRRSRTYIWGKLDRNNTLTCHEGRAFLDVLDAAVSGVNRLSRFRGSGFENWPVYVEHVLEQSSSLRDELRDHPAWWPNIVTITARSARKAEAPTAAFRRA